MKYKESSRLIKSRIVNIFIEFRGGSRAAATSKMECFVRIVITKHFILDVAPALDPPQKVSQDLNWNLFCLLKNLAKNLMS